jgi:glycosyltransferase involved in cell wall biosynthesis
MKVSPQSREPRSPLAKGGHHEHTLRTSMRAIPLSIVLLFYNEEGCAQRVLEEVRAVHPQAEIVAVNDGSTDRTGAIMAAIPEIKMVSFESNRGQSAALYAGLTAAST